MPAYLFRLAGVRNSTKAAPPHHIPCSEHALFSPPLAQTGVFSFSSFFLSLEAACLALFDCSSTLRCNFYNGLMGSGIHGFWSKPDRHPGMPDRLGQRPAYWTFSAFLPYDIDVPFLGCLTYSSNRSSSWPPSSALQLF